ncbi:Asp23/Gls24 family envelope stress response protein [Streptomyces sp. SID1328]|uniref:Asp23/Gls24 family envelope stress response protein n=1 Tax=Streptomyces sp. SID1328 TaxID=2690250 RepID=UPI001368B8C8|nr:Asp23/Gls24 family envelope stress response protein [Streptomyces sp. SID1328]MYV42610.1 Asp23/Gls24 family envelope stress response protein [Streptomyces sp. SID1328]
MSTDTNTAAPGVPDRTPPGERGFTRIADRVVAKIAARAAREAIAPLPRNTKTPHTTVNVRPRARGTGPVEDSPFGTARVRVVVELEYPGDIGARCAAVRRRVTERVGTLANMEVPEVVVEVERLRLPGEHQGRTV